MAKIKKLIMIEEAQDQALRLLNQKTRVPMNVYFREAIDDLIQKYQHILEEKSPKKKGGK